MGVSILENEIESVVRLNNAEWLITYELDGKKVTFQHQGETWLAGAVASVATTDWLFRPADCGVGEPRLDPIGGPLGQGRRLTVVHAGQGPIELTVSMTLYDHFGGLTIEMAARNKGQKPIGIFGFNVIEALGENTAFWPRYGGTDGRFFNSGFHSSSPTKVSLPGEYDPAFELGRGRLRLADPGTLPFNTKDHFIGNWACALRSRTGNRRAALAFITTDRQLGQFLFRRPGHSEDFLARSGADGVEIAPGESMASEVLYISVGQNESELLDQCYRAMGRTMGGRTGVSGTAWQIGQPALPLDEAEVNACVGEAARLKARLPVDRVILNSRWMQAIGDWQPMRAMQELAGRIREAGFEPGLWLAPLTVEGGSGLFREHPDWLIRSGGRPVSGGREAGRRLYGLDVTHPDAERWLRQLIHTVREWGFSALYLDYLYTAALPGRLQDPSVTRTGNLRLGLKTIRQEASNAFLVAANCPPGPGVGIVDAWVTGSEPPNPQRAFSFRRQNRRTGAARNAALNTFSNGRLWVNAVPCSDSVSPVLASLAGNMVLFEARRSLTDSQVESFARAFPPPSGPSSAPGFMDGSRSTAVVRGEPGGDTLVAGLCNSEGDSSLVVLSFEQLRLEKGTPYHAFDLDAAQYIGVFKDNLRSRTLGHGEAQTVALTRVLDRPRIVGTSFGPGAVVHEEWGDSRLAYRVEFPLTHSGAIFIWAPEGMVPVQEGLIEKGQGIYSLPVVPGGPAAGVIAFGAR